MRRLSNDGVVRAFLNREEPAKSHAKNLRYEDGILYSYSDEIARLLRDSTILIRSQAEARSATSSAHVNKVVVRTIPYLNGARVAYERLNAWGVMPEDIESAIERDHFECELMLTGGRCLYRPPFKGIPFIRQFEYASERRVFELNTWFLFDGRPRSAWHAVRSAMGEECWQRVAQKGAYMFGHHLFVCLPDQDGTTSGQRQLCASIDHHAMHYRMNEYNEVTSPIAIGVRGMGQAQRGVVFDRNKRFMLDDMAHACVHPSFIDDQPVIPLIKDWV